MLCPCLCSTGSRLTSFQPQTSLELFPRCLAGKLELYFFWVDCQSWGAGEESEILGQGSLASWSASCALRATQGPHGGMVKRRPTRTLVDGNGFAAESRPELGISVPDCSWCILTMGLEEWLCCGRYQSWSSTNCP